MLFTWDENKRISNLKDHGLNFSDVPSVFEGLTFTFEDDRFEYPEIRFVTLGVLDSMVVSLVHTESDDEIRCISFRYATKNEKIIYFENLT